MESEYFRYDMHKVLPIINQEGSDSAMLDNALEFMVMSGMDLPLAVMVTIPAPWENDKYMDSEIKDFYRYYATMMEPWDGPASILFTDGDVVGAVLDRNGLRPSRYYITEDGYMILASEVGAIDIDQTKVVKKTACAPEKCCWWIQSREGLLMTMSLSTTMRPATHTGSGWIPTCGA